jgi:hypothetical protein
MKFVNYHSIQEGKRFKIRKLNKEMEKEKKFILGQYFTKKEIVDRLIKLLLSFKHYDKDIRILEPSAGTRNFIFGLKEKGFNNVEECEIDKSLTTNPSDFFSYPLQDKFDLIIGNPPFSKYNLTDSYYFPKRYKDNHTYLPLLLQKKEKIQIENSFIFKSIKQIKDKDSSIAFVLPISFFIAKKNKEIKKEIMDNFSTIIIYQNDKTWFDNPIPCCFAIFTNLKNYENKIILLYEDGENVKEILDKSLLLTEELIPKSFLYKKSNIQEGTPLSEFLSEKKVKNKRSYTENNISGSNILEKKEIPPNKNIFDYALAVTRVGNVSVGKTGLINLNEDVLNDMFFVFGFREGYNKDKQLKEKICRIINLNQEHFRNSTIRVGSKSIKKSDILNFKIQE